MVEAFDNYPEFATTIRFLCKRVFEPITASPLPTSTGALFEAFAPPGR
ncbi:MAG: hypothetical protein KF779_09120 [Hyphomonadaceae bacterium]|nr:hypothetical protein [Hyphomonadaceae bacterium]